MATDPDRKHSLGKSNEPPNTPAGLAPALEHIREKFDLSMWKCGELTERFCYAALHPRERPRLEEYRTPFGQYLGIVGQSAHRRFDWLVKIGTPPSIFRAYIDLFQAGQEVNVREQYKDLLAIGIANVRSIKEHPPEWAGLRVSRLIEENSHILRRWIKAVCDTQTHGEVQSDKDFEEIVFWRDWRAPRFIHMQPSGNTPYDPVSAWAREDEAKTEKLLAALEKRFNSTIDLRLRTLTGEAHLRLARRGNQVPERKAVADRRPVSPDLPSSPRLKQQRPSAKIAKTGVKKMDMTKYLIPAKLTDRQYECSSLRYEYDLSVSEIARELNLHRATVEEHIKAATIKIKRSDELRRKLAQKRPDD